MTTVATVMTMVMRTCDMHARVQQKLLVACVCCTRCARCFVLYTLYKNTHSRHATGRSRKKSEIKDYKTIRLNRGLSLKDCVCLLYPLSAAHPPTSPRISLRSNSFRFRHRAAPLSAEIQNIHGVYVCVCVCMVCGVWCVCVCVCVVCVCRQIHRSQIEILIQMHFHIQSLPLPRSVQSFSAAVHALPLSSPPSPSPLLPLAHPPSMGRCMLNPSALS